MYRKNSMERLIFFDLTFYLYLAGVIFYFLCFFCKKWYIRWGSTLIFSSGILMHTFFIIQRWCIAGYPPFTNTFETLVLFSWLLAVGYLCLEFFCKHRVLGFAASLSALIVLAYSSFFPSVIRPLMPALQSNFWILVHVNLCFIGYAAFALAFLCGIYFLLQKRSAVALYILCLIIASLFLAIVLFYCHKTGKITLTNNITTIVQIFFGCCVLAGFLWFPSFFLFSWLHKKNIFTIEYPFAVYIYRFIGIGFTFLTAGIITGAIWANEAWGTYWSWDPKETWSLITWFIYAIPLKLGGKQEKEKTQTYLAWYSILGFFCVLFTYFGVNYLLRGLHSYS